MTIKGTKVADRPLDFRGTHFRNPNGFSLVELLVVIVIIGVIAAISTPKLLSMRPKASVRADGRDLYSALRQAQTEAVKQSEDVCVRVVGSTFEIYVDGGATLKTKQLRPGTFIESNSFGPVPCFNSRGLTVGANSGNIVLASNNTFLKMQVTLTAAGHVSSKDI